MIPTTVLEREALLRRIERRTKTKFDQLLIDNNLDPNKFNTSSFNSNWLILSLLDRTKNLDLLLHSNNRMLFDLSNLSSAYILFRAKPRDVSRLLTVYLEQEDKSMLELLKNVNNKSEMDAIIFIYQHKELRDLLKQLDSEQSRWNMVKTISNIISRGNDLDIKDLILELYDLLGKEYFEMLMRRAYLNFRQIYIGLTKFREIIKTMDQKEKYVTMLSFGTIEKSNWLGFLDRLTNYELPIDYLLQNSNLIASIQDRREFYRDLNSIYRSFKTGKLSLEEYLEKFHYLVWKLQTYVPTSDLDR